MNQPEQNLSQEAPTDTAPNESTEPVSVNTEPLPDEPAVEAPKPRRRRAAATRKPAASRNQIDPTVGLSWEFFEEAVQFMGFWQELTSDIRDRFLAGFGWADDATAVVVLKYLPGSAQVDGPAFDFVRGLTEMLWKGENPDFLEGIQKAKDFSEFDEDGRLRIQTIVANLLQGFDVNPKEEAMAAYGRISEALLMAKTLDSGRVTYVQGSVLPAFERIFESWPPENL